MAVPAEQSDRQSGSWKPGMRFREKDFRLLGHLKMRFREKDFRLLSHLELAI